MEINRQSGHLKLNGLMAPVHYFSDSLKNYCKNNLNGEIHDWLETLSTDDLLRLKYQIEVLLSTIPIGISSHEGFDLIYLAFAAVSQKRRKRIVKLSCEKRERILTEISQSIIDEIEKRCVRLESIVADAEMVFGSAEKARKWMLQNNVALCGTPISLLNTDIGAEEVRKALASISFGGVI